MKRNIIAIIVVIAILFITVTGVCIKMITELRAENKKLKVELEPYKRSEALMNSKIASDPAYATLTDYEYSGIKWSFENAPVDFQFAITSRFPEVGNYGNFLSQTLDYQIEITKKLPSKLGVPEQYTSMTLQQLLRINASTAEKITNYDSSSTRIDTYSGLIKPNIDSKQSNIQPSISEKNYREPWYRRLLSKYKQKEITNQKDGAKMVLIPAGEFQMGSNESSDEKPIHTVYLDAFYIDKYEVTNAQYRKFVQATGHREPEGYGYVNGNLLDRFKPWADPNFNGDDQPVVCVSWEDAKAYADWAGKRLPTEAEWEKAARGGVTGNKYVWGDKWPPPKNAGNFTDISAKKVFTNWIIINGYNDGYTYTAPVGSFKPNGYRLYDMAGNVSEWCADWYGSNYYANSPKSNPTGPSSGSSRIVVRDGSWDCPYGYLPVSFRFYYDPTGVNGDFGFRCAKR